MRGQAFSHYLKLTCLLFAFRCRPLQGVRFLEFRANNVRLLKIGHSKVRSDRLLVNNVVKRPTYVAYNYDKQTVYWINAEKTKIQRIKIGSPPMVSEDVIQLSLDWRPSGLAVDWVGGNIYWSESSGRRGRIAIVKAQGQSSDPLYIEGIRRPKYVSLDPAKGLMFWTDAGRNPKIERANMDGTHRSTVVLLNSSSLLALELDHKEKYIYWTEYFRGKGSIHRITYDGTKLEVVHAGSFHPLIGVLAVYRKRVYWSDRRSMSIRFAKKSGGSRRKKVEGATAAVLLVYEPEKQEKPKVSQVTCKKSNGGCSHFCLPVPRGYTCGCPVHYTLVQRTCVPKQFLLYASTTELHYITIGRSIETETKLPINGIQSAQAVDFDPVQKFVYWTDNVQNNIKRAPIYGTNISLAVEVVASRGLVKPEGIAVDWISRNIYWVNSGAKVIEVSRMDGSIRKTLLNKDLDLPRAIAVDPMKNSMYWNDWGKIAPKIERANLDGSERTVLVQSDIRWPNGLTIDYRRQKLYWSDAWFDKVEVMNVDGSNRSIIARNVPHPFSVSVLGERLYWTDWRTRTLVSVSKLTGLKRTALIEGRPELMGLKAVDLDMTLGSNLCRNSARWCSHMCLSTPTSARCVTPWNSVHQPDRRQVKLPTLIYTDRQNIKTLNQRVTSSNEKRAYETLVIDGLDHAVALDFDYDQGIVFWTDAQSEKILKSRIDSDERDVQEVVSVGLERPEGIAVDWVTKKLYWTDMRDSSTESSRIEVSAYDGTQRKILVWVNVDKPRAVALDPREGYIFWTDCGTEARIERAGMDGSDRRLVISSNIVLPSGLTIDYDSRAIYWTDTTLGLISRANYDGLSRETLLSGVIPHPYALSLHGSVIYWTDWVTRSIHASNTSARTLEKVKSRINEPMGIHVYERNRQQSLSPDANGCYTNNGGCSHLCLLSPRGRSCACPTAMTLLHDGKRCDEGPQKFLLFSRGQHIQRISLDTSDHISVTLPITGIKQATSGLGFDPLHKDVYWTDDNDRFIKKASMDSQMATVVSNDTDMPVRIAVDPIARNLYWTDTKLDEIRVSRLNGSARKTLITDGLDEPGEIAVSPARGYMFWADWGKQPKIERADLDGANRRILVTDQISRPSALAIDHSEQTVYWGDTGLGKIEVMDMSGGRRRVVVSSGLYGINGLGVLGDRLYWTNWQERSLQSASKRTGRDVRLLKKLSYMRTLQAVDMNLSLGINPCGHNNGGCSHLCLFKPSGAICACPSVTATAGQRPCIVGNVSFKRHL